jgi:hypothetical protein
MLTHNICLRHRCVLHSLSSWYRMCVVAEIRAGASLVMCMDIWFKYIPGNGWEISIYFLRVMSRCAVIIIR